jgi:tRNA(Ile)-lysidine synthase
VTAPSPPVADDELDGLFAPLAGERALAVAVSGGPDSTALLHLLDRWSRRRGGPALHVLTVDHGLRPGSADDARFVAALAAALSRPFAALAWRHPDGPPAGDLQAVARATRYRLLATAARERGCAAVALGHTRDDKAETFLIRLARGSGLQGLAAMPAERRFDGIRFVRPLLPVPRARLEATLAAAGTGWRVDPSNDDATRFLRARVRAAMPVLAGLGITAARLAETADRLALADAMIDGLAAGFAADHLVDHGGVVSIDRAALAAAPPELALRVVSAACGLVRPAEHPPRAGSLLRAIAGAGDPAGRRNTAGGLVFHPRRDRLWIHAEAGRAGFPLLRIAAAGSFLWDGRFGIELAAPPPAPLLIRAATGAERRADLPAAAAASLPAAVVEATGAPAGGVRLRPPGADPEIRSTSSANPGVPDAGSGWQVDGPDLHSTRRAILGSPTPRRRAGAARRAGPDLEGLE